jgi:hypothetical protein
MKRKTFFAAGLGAMLCGCGRRASAGQHDVIQSTGEPLRSDFNRDAGKVRIVMLVSPT